MNFRTKIITGDKRTFYEDKRANPSDRRRISYKMHAPNESPKIHEAKTDQSRGRNRQHNSNR